MASLYQSTIWTSILNRLSASFSLKRISNPLLVSTVQAPFRGFVVSGLLPGLIMLLMTGGMAQAQTTVTLNVSDNGSSPWVVPAGVTSITVTMWGGGGGSGGLGTGFTSGGNGTASTFYDPYIAGGGQGSAGTGTNGGATSGGAGGTNTIPGGPGITLTVGSAGTAGQASSTPSVGGNGGGSPNGGALQVGGSAGNAATVGGTAGNEPGGGASGAAKGSNGAPKRATGGGGGGGYLQFVIDVLPGEDYDYIVGSGGAAGAGGEAAGGAGADGSIVITYAVAACDEPDVPTLAATFGTICTGGSSTLSINSGDLNAATTGDKDLAVYYMNRSLSYNVMGNKKLALADANMAKSLGYNVPDTYLNRLMSN